MLQDFEVSKNKGLAPKESVTNRGGEALKL
jgi:hypothetical protein